MTTLGGGAPQLISLNLLPSETAAYPGTIELRDYYNSRTQGQNSLIDNSLQEIDDCGGLLQFSTRIGHRRH